MECLFKFGSDRVDRSSVTEVTAVGFVLDVTQDPRQWLTFQEKTMPLTTRTHG